MKTETATKRIRAKICVTVDFCCESSKAKDTNLIQAYQTFESELERLAGKVSKKAAVGGFIVKVVPRLT